MGEYADMALDAGFDQWGADDPDDYVWSGTLRRRRFHKLKTCRRCGTKDLHWGNTEAGWRLFESSGFMTSTEHECPSVGTSEASELSKAALAKGRAMSEWQPIETAPKDGADSFLLFYEGRRVRPVREGFYRPALDRFGFYGSTTHGEEKFQPTHWMPLPEAPK